MKSAETPTVSITVVAYNSDDCLRDCLRSIRRGVMDAIFEAIVVDNASPDRSARIVAEEFPEVALVRSEINRGFAGGCNLAWPLVRGRYWFLLNPDVVVPPSGLDRLVDWMDRHQEVGVGSPDLVDQMGGVISAGRRFPSIFASMIETLRLHLLMSRERRGELLLGGYRVPGEDHLNVDWVPGTAMIVRREAVEAAGLLSEGELMYGEDMEWCWRIRKAGWRIGVCGALRFQHDEGRSAIRTWGEIERRSRMWQGLYAACAQIHGIAYCRLLMAANALAFAIEAHHPKRPRPARDLARSHLRVHAAMLRRKIRAQVQRESGASVGL